MGAGIDLPLNVPIPQVGGRGWNEVDYALFILTGMTQDGMVLSSSEPEQKNCPKNKNTSVQSRSRSVSVTSRRSFDGVVFADQPELYSHPDDRFGGDKSIEGIVC